MDKTNIIYISGIVFIAMVIVYVYGVAHWGFYYPCSEYNMQNSTVCVHCYSENFQCKCQQFELYQDFEDGYYDCNICPPYKVGDLWKWMNCGNMTKEFVVD